MCALCVALLAWFWPHLGADKLIAPVTVYIAVLCAMVCAALLARFPPRGLRWAPSVLRRPTQ